MSGRTIHGESYSPEYRAWQMARLRCTDPSNAAWPDYGGRGITMCAAWLTSVEAFIADVGRKPTPAHELDRECNDRGYEPGNCRWVLRKVNCRNRRSNRMVQYAGRSQPLAAWCEELRLPRAPITKRLQAGWTPEEAFTLPVRSKASAGHAKPQQHACEDCGRPGTWGDRCRSCENRRRGAARAAT